MTNSFECRFCELKEETAEHLSRHFFCECEALCYNKRLFNLGLYFFVYSGTTTQVLRIESKLSKRKKRVFDGIVYACTQKAIYARYLYQFI